MTSLHTPQASSKVVKVGTTLVLKTDCTLSYLKLPKASGLIQFLNHTDPTFCIATSADPQIDEVVRLDNSGYFCSKFTPSSGILSKAFSPIHIINYQCAGKHTGDILFAADNLKPTI